MTTPAEARKHADVIDQLKFTHRRYDGVNGYPGAFTQVDGSYVPADAAKMLRDLAAQVEALQADAARYKALIAWDPSLKSFADVLTRDKP